MASVNKVIIVGNLGRDPEMRTFPSGDQVANVTIATTDRWRDKNTGENKEATEWHRVVFNGRLAEIVGQYLRKGSQVYVEGSLRTRKWTDQQTGQERYATEIRADTMQMLGSRPNNGDDRDRGGYDDRDRGNGQGGYRDERQQQRGDDRGGYRDDRQQYGRDDQQRGNRGTQDRSAGNQQPDRRNGQTGQQAQQRGDGGQNAPRGNSGFDDMDDDIPF